MKINIITIVFSFIMLMAIQISTAPSNPHELQHFSDIVKLQDLTKAFFSQPEFVGDFQASKSNQPSPEQRGLTAQAFSQVLKALNTTFINKTSTQNKSFFDPTKWLGTPISPMQTKNQTNRYVQKIKVSPNSTICVMGDFHGSMHSLLRNLLRLQALGNLNEDLTIKNKNFYMVFLGDYVDRGRWSTEVLTILIKLKLQNWHQVFLLAGNHECKDIAERDGFKNELVLKYGKQDGENLFNNVDLNFFRILPVALFIECNNNIIQCCHGGIAKDYKPKNLLESSDILFENV